MPASELQFDDTHSMGHTDYDQDDIETVAPAMPSYEELRKVLSKELAYALTASLV